MGDYGVKIKLKIKAKGKDGSDAAEKLQGALQGIQGGSGDGSYSAPVASGSSVAAPRLRGGS